MTLTYFKYLLIIQFQDQNYFQDEIFLTVAECNKLQNIDYAKMAGISNPLSNRNDPLNKYRYMLLNLRDVRYIILERQ